ncbi:MAG: response regulator [candidate division NC10 bacterium]|nr:response regulator [candidate division NC10 bacterium]
MAGEKILVVEDEPLITQMLGDLFGPLAFEVLIAHNGVEALELAWEKEPDLILLDIMMPKIDGFEVAKILKENPKTRHIPIIFLTAKVGIEDKIRGFQLGADDYITKPFQPQELLARIQGVLRRVKPEKEETPGMKGSLKVMSLPNLLQLLEIERKSGVLTLVKGEERGLLYLREGRIVNAILGRLRGEVAVYRLLSWEEGEFELDPSPTAGPPEAQVTASTQQLIMEGMRRKDEVENLRAKLPPLSSRLKVSPKLYTLLQGKPLTPDLQAFLSLVDGRRTIEQVIEASGLDRLQALEDIARLFAKGMLERTE